MRHTSLNVEAVLQRPFQLELSIQGDTVTLSSGGQSLRATPHALAILEVFETPKTLRAGLEELSARSSGARDWIRMNTQVLALARSGFLSAPETRQVALPSHTGSFSSPDIHIRMLNDRARTLAYQQALREVVQPTDVVVDVGTGTGVLAASAALAGARHVYAVERTGNMPRLAREFFRANGLADRITLIEGDSSRIELPERADVMVSEIIGNDPLAEGILSTTADACRRLLKPNVRLIPYGLRLYALPLNAPAGLFERVVFTAEQAERWRESYGLDFSNYAADSSTRNFSTTINTARVKDWPRLAAPILVEAIDLSEDMLELIEASCVFEVEADGMINCVVLYFEAQLALGVSLSIHPDQAEESNSWASWAWLPGRPLPVSAGQRLQLDYRFDVQRKSTICLTPLQT